jgi:UDP-N-acetylglucosamine 4,6-dehydratase
MAELEVIGIRPGEKLHEVLINEDEARSTVELEDMFVVQPTATLWFGRDWQDQGRLLEQGFRYTSETNPQWLTVDQIRELISPINDAFFDEI